MKSKALLVLKLICWLSVLAPLAWLVYAVLMQQLSADPAKDIQHFTGRVAIRLILVTLLLSPLGRYRAFSILNRIKRLIGLSAFFWATLHIFTYFSLELGFSTHLFFTEITSRNYLIIGLCAWLGLLTLALTSSKYMMKLLKKWWKRIHNWVYIFALLAAIHYLLSLKLTMIYPVLYMMTFSLLWIFHFYRYYANKIFR